MKQSKSAYGLILKHPVMLVGLMLLFTAIVLLNQWSQKESMSSSVPMTPPAAKQGMLDWSNLYTDQEESIPLDGEWEFYWRQLLEPTDFQAAHTPVSNLVELPAPWTNYSDNSGGFLSSEGYATYRLRILLPQELSEGAHPLALYPKSIASAYRIWINGHLVGGNGIVGTNRISETPKSYPEVVYFQPRTDWNEIIIQVSNFSQRNAGIWQHIELGSADSISWTRILHVSAQSGIVGIFGVMALYYAFVFWNRKKETSALLYSLLCMAVGVRTVVLGESTALYLLPRLPWEWAVKAEYISVAMTALLLILFINREYPAEAVRQVSVVSGVILPGCILLFLMTPAHVYTYLLTPFTWGVLFPALLYTLYIYLRSATKRRKGAVSSMIGFLFFMAFALNDMLFYTVHLPTEDMLSIGLLVFLLTQAYNLSSRFSRALHESEQLSLQLQETNQHLEQIIEERTRSLRRTNAELQEANQKMSDAELFRTRLLSNISHELSTPITSIKGFAKALRDGIITADAPKYVNRIYTRSVMLERMIHDLIDLTKLETHQVQFRMQNVYVIPFMQELFLKYETDVQANGIQYIMDLPAGSDLLTTGSEDWLVQLDPIRMEQVLSNLISNALRFTSPAGIIHVNLRLTEAPETEKGWMACICVKDTGVGILPEWQERIFERFEQASPPSVQDEHKGSGLGLAICKEIMHYHHGDIGVSSKPGSGSEFCFRLPAWKGRLSPHDKP
ncbi:signal transduction histidine kinase [Paenibacillus barcinonensis]|uniref:histidine kinase n=2 Tax=Paenibacillus barcinonensis TaxID=198119 RepID=A0A2V4VKH9_PAEBA|nr:sensor histidine kinase [Paenibacillus barcinonensis]PYE49744.1 signal transduction histidine kinase [Paenibacillus barcinonensis]